MNHNHITRTSICECKEHIVYSLYSVCVCVSVMVHGYYVLCCYIPILCVVVVEG